MVRGLLGSATRASASLHAATSAAALLPTGSAAITCTPRHVSFSESRQFAESKHCGVELLSASAIHCYC